MAKILVTPRSLTKGGDPTLDLLRKAGYEVVFCTPGKSPDEAELARLLPGCVGWLAGVEKITDAVLAKAPALLAISRNGTGVDSIDLEACKRRGIPVLRAEGANARGVAELTLGLALALLRSIPFSDARMKAGGWERRQGAELEEKTLGVIGTGKIGKLVARFGLAVGMNVVGADRYPDAALSKTPGFRYAPVAELLAESDIVTLHCPHEPGAKPLVDAAALVSMKKGAYLVNTARSGLVDADAVLQSLADGRLAGYAADAYDTEPPAAHPLFAHERVITTPHVGAYTAESVARATRAAVDNLLAALGKGA
ncbi:MAG: phosphoglycerate dehydrogenase [Spirochaetes bacterium]|nr:phosphoglycerate dehydrogenase [Spirochaetota bacterium]